MKKNIFEIALALGLAVSLVVSSLALDTQQDIADKLIRLHIIANSDSQEDQALKLKVRDKILDYVSDITSDCKSIDEARTIVSKNLGTLKALADEVIISSGFSYSSSAELSVIYFPTKVYDNFSLPAGEYEALRIRLGDASGQNWWCVLFPPVCVSAAEAECELENAGLTGEEINFVMSDEVEYRFKFKIVEIIEAIKGIPKDASDCRKSLFRVKRSRDFRQPEQR